MKAGGVSPLASRKLRLAREVLGDAGKPHKLVPWAAVAR